MLQAAERLQGVLLPFLFITGSLLGALFAFLLIQRLVRELVWRRRQTLVARYGPLVDGILQFGLTAPGRERLGAVPKRHRRIVADLLLAPLHAARGDLVSQARLAAAALGLVAQWRADLEDGRWWRRADGIRALGFVEDVAALPAILHALGDVNGEVRSAAVEAAGRLGDVQAIPALLAHLADASRSQRARVIDALRSLGPPVTPALVAFALAQPVHARLAADVLGLIGTVAAIDPLLDWCVDSRAEVRAAALGALASIGLDDRTYYYVLRALGDSDPRARAMAARALGRGRREEAVDYLAERLDDEWLPAAEAAGALRRLGGAGLAALQARADDQGQAGDLARQMLWARRPAAAPAGQC